MFDYDSNHVGDAGYLNQPAALAAISATNNPFSCGTGTDAASIDCAIAAGATIHDYAGNGLDSANAFASVLPCPTCAFSRANPHPGPNQKLFSIRPALY